MRHTFHEQRVEDNQVKQKLFEYLMQAENTNQLLGETLKNENRNSGAEGKLTINAFIKVNEYRNKKLQIEKKLDIVSKTHKAKRYKRMDRLEKAEAEIKGLKLRRTFFQMKLKLFYLEILRDKKKIQLTGPEIVQRLWNIKVNVIPSHFPEEFPSFAFDFTIRYARLLMKINQKKKSVQIENKRVQNTISQEDIIKLSMAPLHTKLACIKNRMKRLKVKFFDSTNIF